ncbi:hypothetical protein IZU28_06295 [Treponema socranskii]|uniref:hypothetical protein n=1 Tax=Treponema socranskii TaxID=53419 RepID=UPI003D8CA428
MPKFLRELLNGIGTSSLQDALCKTEAFENGFIEIPVSETAARKCRGFLMEHFFNTAGQADEGKPHNSENK